MKQKQLLLIVFCQLSMQTFAMNQLISLLPSMPSATNLLAVGATNKVVNAISSVATAEAATFTGFKALLGYCPVINPLIHTLGLHKSALPVVMFAQTNQNPVLGHLDATFGVSNLKKAEPTYKNIWNNLKDAKYKEALNEAGSVVVSKVPPLIIWGALCARAMKNPGLTQVAVPLTMMSLAMHIHNSYVSGDNKVKIEDESLLKQVPFAMNTFYTCAFGLGILGFKSAKVDHNIVWWGVASLLTAVAMDRFEKMEFFNKIHAKLPDCMQKFCTVKKLPLISFALFGWLLPMYWK